MATNVLDMNLDPIERIKWELKYTSNNDSFSKAIGNFLIEKMTDDKVLQKCYFDKKILLSDIVDYVVKQAQEYLKNKNGAIEDKVVFGWVLHYVQDNDKIKRTTNKVKIVTPDKPKAKVVKKQDDGLEQMRLF